MDEKQSLIKQKDHGDGLRELRLHHGWKELENIFKDIYSENLKLLLNGENLEARANLKALQEIADRIELGIGFAEKAKEDLKSEKFKTPDTP